MLTAASAHHSAAREFVARGAAWGLGLFAVLRLGWTETHVVMPATEFQGRLAIGLLGTPSAPITATLACSGTDALALCVAAIAAYPAPWRSRVTGAAGGLILLLGLNTLRIGTLGRAAASPEWFQALHVFVWPAILTFAIAGYVFWWMRGVDAAPRDARVSSWQPPRRFILMTLAFLAVFIASAPWYLDSSIVLVLAGVVARSAALILNSVGASSHVTANILSTPGGHFVVTQECIVTPLIPLYFAAAFTYSPSRRRLAACLLAAIPLFMALGIARLLLVALPPSLGSPLFFVHAFYQLALGLIVIVTAAAWRHGRAGALRYGFAGIALGIAFIYLAGPVYAAVAGYSHAKIDDPQGAIAFLPIFQAGLYLALSAAVLSYANWKALLTGFAILTITQVFGAAALQAIAADGSPVAVRDIRAWAILGPVLTIAVIAHVAPPRR